MRKFIVLLPVIISTILFRASSVEAKSLQDSLHSRYMWKADETISVFPEQYSLPQNIVVASIPKKNIALSEVEDIRELYYYFATRSKFGDLPFHFLVAENGEIFAGNKLGTEAKVDIDGKTGAVFIGYLSAEKGKLTGDTMQSLETVLLSIMNEYAIAPKQVSLMQASFQSTENGTLKEMKLKDPSAEADALFRSIREGIKADYKPKKREVQAEVDSVVVPEETLKVETTSEVKLKVKNTSGFALYGGTSYSLYIARTNPLDERSKFFVSDVWESFSRVGVLSDGERLEADAEKEISFKVFVPLYPPKVSEDFILVDFNGNVINGTKFTVTLKIGKPKETIIEIQDMPGGFLNVRDRPGIAKVITKVPAGSRYISLDYYPGYYKIKADNGKVGWVFYEYVKVVKFD